MQKSNQNKKIIKLMSGVLAILTISSPTSLATKPIQLEDKPGILEKFKSFAWPAAIIGGAIIITGAIIYGISKIKESRNIEEFKRNLDLALKDITNKADVEYMLNEIKEMLVPKVENNRINEFEIRFAEFKTRVQTLDNINAAKRDLLQGLHAIVKAFNVRFDTNEFNNLKSNKSEKNENKSFRESNKPKLQLPNEFKVFKIAIIGSDINGNNKIEDEKYGEESSLKKFTVGRLCSHEMVKKLSEYEGVTVQNGEIFYKNKSLEIPKDSIYLDDTVLSFYYVNNCEDANRILPKCQYAICPFIAKLDEITGDLDADLKECELKKRMIRLKSFVKNYNGMCDIRFLYYTDELEKSDRFDNYIYSIGQLCINLYTDGLQQDISSKNISKTSEREDYKVFLKHIALECSEQRAKEFKNWAGNDVLHINRYQ